MKLFSKIAALLLAASVLGPAQALTIDNFDTGGDFLFSPFINGPITTVGLNTNDTIGGTRTMRYQFVSGSFASVEVDAAFTGSAQTVNTLAMSNPAAVTSFAVVHWDNNGAGLGGVDLTDGTIADAIELDVLSIDQGGITLTIAVRDTSNNFANLQLTNLGTGTQTFLFQDFQNFANTDFTAIDFIELSMFGNVASDFILDNIRTRRSTDPNETPIPGGVVLFLLGGGIAYRARRKLASS